MLFDFATMPASARYRLLTATVVPRPIAWVVTQDAAGLRNAAPFSFFNAFGEDPPVVCIGIGPRESEAAASGGGPFKDSGANIRATGEFVVNLVSEALMQAMHVTAIGFPPGTDELAEAGLTTAPSSFVAPPRIAESPVALECVRHTIVELGTDRTLVVGRVLAMHVADMAVVDAGRARIDTDRLGLVARIHGPGGYLRADGGGRFTRDRITLGEWRTRPPA